MKKISKKGKIAIIIISVMVVVIGSVIAIAFNSLNKVNTVAITKSDEELGITTEDNDEFEKEAEEETEDKTEEENKTLNIALYGIDKRTDDTGRSDTIMILSIDYQHNEIKLSSIMRDTYVAIDGHGMTKINHAYAYGGPLLSMKTINQNFNLDLRDYVLVDFEGLKDIVDELGGVDITIKSYEIPSMKAVGINSAGDYHLNGTQALAYCRIRYQGNGDYERTDRQREVLQKLFEGLETNDLVQMTSVLNKILPYVETSFTKTDIIALMTSVVTSNTTNLLQKRFPVDGSCHGEMINGVYYLVIDKDETTEQLKDFIYN
ncbi:LCP family protein [Clostridium sp. DL1XJH146]